MPPSGRYQSQLFSFLSQQSLRLRDQVGRTVRQAKVAATWGTQVVLYPVYALFQTGRLVGKQLRGSGGRDRGSGIRDQGFLRSASRAGIRGSFGALREWGLGIGENAKLKAGGGEADTPLRRTLETLQELGLPVALPPARREEAQKEKGSIGRQMRSITTNLVKVGWFGISKAIQRVKPSSQSAELATRSQHALKESPIALDQVASPFFNSANVQIQGIATLLATRAIVLTTIQNEILDILTFEQQALLQRRMTYELADYWHNQRRLQIAQHAASHPLPLPSDRPQLLPPVRWFRRLMAWMQTSPVAASTNLFQESALLEAFVQRYQQPKALPPSHLEATPALEPKWMPSYPGQSFVQWVDQQLKAIPSTSSLAPSQSMTPKRSRRRKNPTPPGQLVSHSNILPPVQATPGKGDRLSPSVPPVTAISPQTVESSGLTQSQEGDRSLVDSPTWIETKATVVGYVKHPLEQLLEWLDLAMLWIEKRLAWLWKKLRS